MYRFRKLLALLFVLSCLTITFGFGADIGVGIQFSAENFGGAKMDFYPGFNVLFLGGTGYVGGMLTFDLVSEGASSSIYGLTNGDMARLASLFIVGQYPIKNLTLYLGPGVGAYLDKDNTMCTTIQDQKMFFMKLGGAYRFSSVNIFLESVFYTYVAPFRFLVDRPKIIIGGSYMF